MAKKTVIFGATSSLGVALCRMLAAQHKRLYLIGRNAEALEALATDCAIRGAETVEIQTYDLQKHTPDAKMIAKWGGFDRLFMLAGSMGNGEKEDMQNLSHVALINYTAPSQVLSLAAADMAAQGGGEIAVVTSVAGDRGRQSNYEYGAAKAALATYAAGLRNRYHARNVHIMTVKPGFIDTPMTFGMESPLMATRREIAKGMLKALDKRKNTVYLPWFWKFIMLIILHIPEFIFKKMKL